MIIEIVILAGIAAVLWLMGNTNEENISLDIITKNIEREKKEFQKKLGKIVISDVWNIVGDSAIIPDLVVMSKDQTIRCNIKRLRVVLGIPRVKYVLFEDTDCPEGVINLIRSAFSGDIKEVLKKMNTIVPYEDSDGKTKGAIVIE